MTKKGVEFLIGWTDFPLDKDDTWERITSLPGSEHMIAEFQKHWQEERENTNAQAASIDIMGTWMSKMDATHTCFGKSGVIKTTEDEIPQKS